MADSLPQEKLREWLAKRQQWLAARGLSSPDELKKLPPAERREFADRFSAKLNDWLDAGMGTCALADPAAAGIVEDVLRHFDGDRYALGEFVVMPNHVHLLVTPAPDWELSNLEQAWKSISAKRINELHGTSGPLWQHESFDHIVRDADWLAFYERYIRENPLKARLPEDKYRTDAEHSAGSHVAPTFGRRHGTACEDSAEVRHSATLDIASAAHAEGRPIVGATLGATLGRLTLRHFRCFEQFETEFVPGTNFIVGPMRTGKHRCWRPRASCCGCNRRASSARARGAAWQARLCHGRLARGSGICNFTSARSGRNSRSTAWSRRTRRSGCRSRGSCGLGMTTSNWCAARGKRDGASSTSSAMQRDAGYRASLRSFEHALRSRNHLLKQPLAALAGNCGVRPTAASNTAATCHAARRSLLGELQTEAEAAHFAISGKRESLRLNMLPGDGGDFAAALAAAEREDARLRQTTVGPHRDDVRFF